MIKRVFYAWQAQRANKENRSLIEAALEKAIKRLNEKQADDTITIDQDSREAVGAQEIGATLLDKIRQSSAVVADISFVGNLVDGRPTPNPNVMFELGFAWRELPEQRIALVFNQTFGAPDDIPFDISKRNLLQYHYSAESDESPSHAREHLATMLEQWLRVALRDSLLQAMLDYALTEDDCLVFATACELMIDTDQTICDFAMLVERCSLNSDQITESASLLDKRGLWDASAVMGGQYRYSHVRANTAGLEIYCRRRLPGYSALYEKISAGLASGAYQRSTQLADAFNQPSVIVEQVLNHLAAKGMIRCSTNSSGVYVHDISADLRRTYKVSP